MSTVAVIIGIVAALVAILGVVIGVVVFVRGAYGAARLQAVREDNNDLRAGRADDQRQHEVDMAKIEALTQRVSQLESEGVMLREMALQHANVDKAIDAIKAHDVKSEKTWGKVIALIENIGANKP